jgi:hypothetical protein
MKQATIVKTVTASPNLLCQSVVPKYYAMVSKSKTKNTCNDLFLN